MKSIKRLSRILAAAILTFSFIMLPVSKANAQESDTTTSGQIVETETDGNLTIVTIIEENITEDIATGITRASSQKIKTGTKTAYYYGNDGSLLWYVRVRATFSYNGSSATCTSASVSAVSQASTWAITNRSRTYSGNKATATATAKQYYLSVVILTVTRSVTLTCSPTGTFS